MKKVFFVLLMTVVVLVGCGEKNVQVDRKEILELKAAAKKIEENNNRIERDDEDFENDIVAEYVGVVDNNTVVTENYDAVSLSNEIIVSNSDKYQDIYLADVYQLSENTTMFNIGVTVNGEDKVADLPMCQSYDRIKRYLNVYKSISFVEVCDLDRDGSEELVINLTDGYLVDCGAIYRGNYLYVIKVDENNNLEVYLSNYEDDKMTGLENCGCDLYVDEEGEEHIVLLREEGHDEVVVDNTRKRLESVSYEGSEPVLKSLNYR